MKNLLKNGLILNPDYLQIIWIIFDVLESAKCFENEKHKEEIKKKFKLLNILFKNLKYDDNVDLKNLDFLKNHFIDILSITAFLKNYILNFKQKKEFNKFLLYDRKKYYEILKKKNRIENLLD